ncbi:transcription intermediary factor 1-alpha-like isoform X2 [Mercenaria mercenaria]|uniref:transcription intermediary factor 1-alpha-like isoform X2 n=1 Tax=Mercenaria mercenaria TaxID=6596 RepID=UPI00234F11D2|nr:transcription intermediary factor 1-alpha-like isoform X2 [Mercenaria mercenaria]
MASSGVVGNTSEETFDMLCSACKEQNINKEAEKYCVDCRDYYCSECLKLHSTLPALKGHKLLGKEAGQSGQLLMVPTERCERHDFKTVDMFCQNHDQIGCGTCIAVDHRLVCGIFMMASVGKDRLLDGGTRSSVITVGDDKGSVFVIDFDNKKKKDIKVPERLQKYSSKKKTAEEIARSQALAEERKKKHDENKAKNAKKVREEVVRFDKMVQAKLGQSSEPKGRKWYSHAIKGD